jgi:hypothetical protein
VIHHCLYEQGLCQLCTLSGLSIYPTELEIKISAWLDYPGALATAQAHRLGANYYISAL